MATAQEIKQEIVDKVLAALEKGRVPWRKPWSGGGAAHRNAVTGRRYSGINPFLLAMTAIEKGFSSPEWLTFNQARAVGGNVRKGEKGSKIVFYSIIEKLDKATGKKDKIPLLRSFTVFNREQCENLPPSKIKTPTLTLSPIDAAEAVIESMPQRPAFNNRNPSDSAYYNKATDVVVVPMLSQYANANEYYLTAFHELAHSTGHESRLKRESMQGINPFGSHEYSKEELVAEMAAAMLAAECGIEQTITENSLAYLSGWAAKFRDEPGLIISAASQAQKAVDFILNRKQDEEKEETENE